MKAIKHTSRGNFVSERYDSFNGLRACAALGILLMHYLANIGSETSESLRCSGILYSEIIPFFTSFVYMFFIVSSFSMCCGYYESFNVVKCNCGTNKSVRMSRFNTEGFYSKRYMRIWPFFALLVLLDFLLNPSWEEFCQAFANLTLAFNLLPNPHIKVIGVGWFLGVIFLFYMIFPWFAFLLQNKVRAWGSMAISIVFHIILVHYFLTNEFCTTSQINAPRHNIIYSFPFFMSGGLIYIYRDLIRRAFVSPCSKYILLAMCVMLTGLIFTPYQPSICGEAVLYQLVVFTLWICYAITGGISFAGFKILDNRIMTFISGISMEIYLCHMVMFRLIEKVHIDRFIQNTHAYYWAVSVLGIVLTILFSYMVKKNLFPVCSILLRKLNV